jgi:hypothetical protein
MMTIAILAASVSPVPSATGFDADFTGMTLRVDYYHVGTATEEQIALDRVRVEGEWPGSRTRLLDDSNLGKYLVEVVDLASNRMLYSRGFASIYGEWETTSEASAGIWRSLAEAVRIPEPRRPFQIRLRKRGPDQSFAEIWSTVIDPASRFVDRAEVPARKILTVMDHGSPAVKVDLLVLGDGYSAGEMGKFKGDVERLIGALFETEPFSSRRDDFNVRAIETPAELSGISRPRAGIFRNSPLGARYNSFDSERYILTLQDRAWRDVAAAAPYDVVLILVNECKYGGGGIFNLYSTAAVDSAFASYLVVHEFGHHFAGLGDEYYTSDVAYEKAGEEHVEPWERNVTALHDPDSLKWRELMTADTPLPTPWSKQEYEKRSLELQERRRRLRAEGAPEEALEKLFREERRLFTAMLANEEHAGEVGAFEGAMYEAKGLYRPTADCIMFTRDEVGFCPVADRGLHHVYEGRSRLLPCLPEGHRAGYRFVRPLGQQLLHHLQEVIRAYRLGDVAFRRRHLPAGRDELLEVLGDAGHEDDRDVLEAVVVLQGSVNTDARFLRHCDIQRDQVGRIRLDQLHRLFAIHGGLVAVAGVIQYCRQKFMYVRLVIHHQDLLCLAGHRGSPCVPSALLP